MNTIVDIQNNPEIYKYLLAKATRLNWKFDSNISLSNPNWLKYPNATASLFMFDYEEKKFSWFVGDAARDGSEHVITSLAEAIAFMEFVEKNQEAFVEVKPTWKLKITTAAPKNYIPMYKYDSYGAPYSYGSYSGKSEYVKTVKATDWTDNSHNSYSMSAETYEKLLKVAKESQIALITSEHGKSKKDGWMDEMDKEVEKILNDKIESFYAAQYMAYFTDLKEHQKQPSKDNP